MIEINYSKAFEKHYSIAPHVIIFGSPYAQEVIEHEKRVYHTKKAALAMEDVFEHWMEANGNGHDFAEMVYTEICNSLFDYTGDTDSLHEFNDGFFMHMCNEAETNGMMPKRYYKAKKQNKKLKKQLKRIASIVKKYGGINAKDR